MHVYSVLDLKAKRHGVPFFVLNDAMAIRAFTRVVNDEASYLYTNPEDFVLVRLAHWDEEEGVFTNHTDKCCDGKCHEMIAQAHDLKKPDNQVPFPFKETK